MRNQVFKKLFSVLLALIMVAGLLPASVLAEGEGNAEPTAAPTETVQPTESAEPTEPAKTETPDEPAVTPEATEVPEPTPENPATTEPAATDEPAAEPTPAEEVTIAPVNEVAAQADAAISYVTKTKSVPLPDGTFYRIVHLDCGRKYFTEAQIKQIIDYAYDYGYTHVELAFGNDGLRFLLDDMSVTVANTIYESSAVKTAIQQGNASYSHSGELSTDDMNNIIAYAKEKGIGIIPMFDAPGHLQAVVKAMETLKVDVKYTTPTQSGSSWNYAVDPTDAVSVSFIQALMQKYITYFADKGCTMFNIAADECGFTGMSADTYTAYAKLVNSMAAMVQNAGMTALAFNDGIYHIGLKLESGVEFDTDIAVCYWDASSDKYAPAATLAGKGFKIINTHNKWYYVPGNSDGDWYGYTWSQGYMNGDAKNCKQTDGGYNGDKVNGCMNAIWLDNPSVNLTNDIWTKIEGHIALLATNNPTYFVASKISIADGGNITPVAVKDSTDKYTVTVKKDTEATVQLKIENMGDSVTWKSSDDTIATVENGLVTFKGKDGEVTITAAAGDVKKTITFVVALEGEVELTEKRITVELGKDYVLPTITGENLAREEGYTTENPEIATVTVTGTDATEGGEPTYDSNEVTYSSLAGNNTSWTKTNYYYKVGDNYYPVYAYRQRQGRNYYYYYYYGYSITDNANNVTQIGNRSSSGNAKVNVYKQSVTDPVEASTDITFHGEKVGETTVVIGNVKYIINVIAEDLSNAKDFYIQLWITNVGIQVDNLTKQTSSGTYGNAPTHYVTITAGSAYGKAGVALSELVPDTIKEHKENAGTWWDKTRYTDYPDEFDEEKFPYNFILAKGTTLASGNYQNVWQDNKYASGNDFQYVRYYGGKWWVSIDNTDETKWVEVTNSSVDGSGTQVIAYYMQETKVTTEVTTYVVDWGNAAPDKTAGVIVDYSVKYSDGTQIPKKSEFPIKGKTMFFRMISDSDTVRRIYDVKALETTNREVYMITVTPNSDVKTDTITLTVNDASPNYSYSGTEKVAWVKDESDLPVEFQDESTHYTSINGLIKYTVGGDPSIAGVEIYKNQAMLITYYLRDVVTKDTLFVHYIDKTADKEFYQYTITVNENTFFDERIDKKADPNWKDYLDYGTVKNDLDVDITVSADLGTMPKIGAEYRYADYYCESVKWANGGKDVYLYYTFKYDVTFVVDFGLPLVITPDKVNASLGNANITSTVIKQTSYYADIEVVDIKNVVYKLNSTIDGEDNFTVTYKGANLQVEGQPEGSVTYTIRIIPATNVYYEDSFASFHAGSGAAAGATWNTVYDTDITAETNPYANATQALEALGQEQHNPYGYDPAYDKCTMFSMGSAHKVTVTSDMAKEGVVWPTAQFTFKGTGFDIISLTDNTSGAIYVSVYTGDKAEGTPKKYVVNNYYGYDYVDGKWVVKTDTGNNALYQIPVIKIKDLGYDTYTVVIKVAYSAFQDVADKKQYSFWLDAVRVYDPMGANNSDTYAPDGEAKPVFVEVRDMLLSASSVAENETNNGMVFIDGNGSAVIATDYKNFGPNHEVYLAKNQAIAFKIADATKYTDIQIGIKSIGNNAVTYKINDAQKNIGTATDMYYSIKNYASSGSLVTITNIGEAVLSITNIKCTMGTSSAETDTVELVMSAEDVATAISMVNSAITPVEPEPEPEPEKTFEPDRFEASWSRNVMQGRKATLTVKASEDVEAITVDGQTIRSYRTRTERVGFGRYAKRVTYREFTYSMVAQETADFSVTAINAEGTESKAITARLTVQKRPGSIRDVWNWFKGWF